MNAEPKSENEREDKKHWEKEDYKRLVIKIVKIVFWLIGLYGSCFLSLENLYFILSCFYFIFTNLGSRKEGQMSAYSVFNKGFKRLPGTFSAEEMFKGKTSANQELVDEKLMSNDEEERAKSIDEYFKNQSKYGNKSCYCGSDLKFKKCCLIKKKQEEEEERKKRLQQKLKP